MNRDTGCCVGNSSCTLWPVINHSNGHTVASVAAEDYLCGSWLGLAGCLEQWESAAWPQMALGTEAFGDFSCS